MLYSRNTSIASAAVMLLAACCMTRVATAGDSDGRSAGIFDSAMGAGPRELLAALDGRMPLEPRLPGRRVICATLRAELTSVAFASPTTTDPDVDSIAAVAANPVSSNPTRRVSRQRWIRAAKAASSSSLRRGFSMHF